MATKEEVQLLPGSRLLRIAAAAQRLEMKEAGVRGWILRRKIAVVKLSPRAIRIPESEIERIIRERTIPAR